MLRQLRQRLLLRWKKPWGFLKPTWNFTFSNYPWKFQTEQIITPRDSTKILSQHLEMETPALERPLDFFLIALQNFNLFLSLKYILNPLPLFVIFSLNSPLYGNLYALILLLSTCWWWCKQILKLLVILDLALYFYLSMITTD